jgi:hypothetical protein
MRLRWLKNIRVRVPVVFGSIVSFCAFSVLHLLNVFVIKIALASMMPKHCPMK